mgnify:FL=1
MLKKKSALPLMALLCLSLVIGGCASGISLDESNAANAGAATAANAANAAGVDNNGVAGVEINASESQAQQPPAS